jgi:hypothetical protein
VTREQDFSIEYLSPGIVHSGRHDITDFALRYRQGLLVLDFIGVGVWSAQGTVEGYEVQSPRALHSMPPALAQAVWLRVRDYIRRGRLISHDNVSMKPLSPPP